MKSPARRAVLDGVFWQMPRQLDAKAAGQRQDGDPVEHHRPRRRAASTRYLLEVERGTARTNRGIEGPDPKLTITMDGVEFLRLISGNSDPMAAYFKGRIQLAGDIMVAAQLAQIFKMPGGERGPSTEDGPATANGGGELDDPSPTDAPAPAARRGYSETSCMRRGRRSSCAAWSSALDRSRPWTAWTWWCPPGVCFGLLGPNGAGKSTTMRMLTAQTLADEGAIEVLGYTLPRESKQARMAMGVVPQLDNLDVELTARQILDVFAQPVPGAARRARPPRWSARWTSPTCARAPTRSSATSRAGCAAACSSRAASSTARSWCCSTSRRWALTRRCARSCGR